MVSRRFLKGSRSSYRRAGSKTRKYGTNNIADKSLAVYRNPFSNANTNPKIPDGKILASCGLRCQARSEIKNDSDSPMYILVYPGLMSGMYVQSALSDLTGATDGITDQVPFTYAQHAIFNKVGTTDQYKSQDVAAWRLVSQGVRLSLLNTSDYNDGYWEAIRLPVDPSLFAMRWDMATSTDGSTGILTVDNSKLVGAGIAHVGNMINNPSYRSGKLRDIHKQTFMLKPHSGSHEPLNLGQPIKLAGTIDLATEIENFNISTPVPLLDTTFDCILIRIVGRTNAGTTPTPTRLLGHLVSNQEVVYRDDSLMSRFHSDGYISKKLEYTRKAICSNSASTTRRMV